VFTEAVGESRMVTTGFSVTNSVIRITGYPVTDLESLWDRLNVAYKSLHNLMSLVGNHLHHRLLYRVTKLNSSKHVN
jgi:hypothetical protein